MHPACCSHSTDQSTAGAQRVHWSTWKEGHKEKCAEQFPSPQCSQISLKRPQQWTESCPRRTLSPARRTPLPTAPRRAAPPSCQGHGPLGSPRVKTACSDKLPHTQQAATGGGPRHTKPHPRVSMKLWPFPQHEQDHMAEVVGWTPTGSCWQAKQDSPLDLSRGGTACS